MDKGDACIVLAAPDIWSGMPVVCPDSLDSQPPIGGQAGVRVRSAGDLGLLAGSAATNWVRVDWPSERLARGYAFESSGAGTAQGARYVEAIDQRNSLAPSALLSVFGARLSPRTCRVKSHHGDDNIGNRQDDS
jgi:hypothetical protein